MKGNQIMNNNTAFDWDSVIEDDSNGYQLLTPGEYIGRVIWFDRDHFSGSAKMPACPKAVITIALELPDGKTAELVTTLLVHPKTEWKLSEFFRAIGQKKHGERLKMDWSKVIGSRICVHVQNRKYTNRDGEERTVNDIDRYLDYDPSRFPADPKWLEEAMSQESEEEVDYLGEVF